MGGDSEAASRPSVSAVITVYNRRDALAIVLDRLEPLPLAEIVVVDNASSDGSGDVARARGGRIRVVEAGANLGIAGRNVGAREARGELLLMLDDDAYPRPGAIEALRSAFVSNPRLGAAGGFVRDVDATGRVLLTTELGTFDWWLRSGRGGPVGPEGLPAFFFPEGASMLRRTAYLDVGGYYEPYFLQGVEIDLATRLLAAGWEVRYFPDAPFDHMKSPAARNPSAMLELRIRNQIWYFARLFPATVAARRIPAYLAFDLIECAYRGAIGSWFRGVTRAWRERGAIERSRLPRGTVRRAELNRGRTHMRLLSGQLTRRLAARGR